MKVCYIDTETTGLHAVKNDVIQIAGIIEIDGVKMEEFEFKCQPFDYGQLNPYAMKVHGLTEGDLRGFPLPEVVCLQFMDLLSKYLEPLDKFTFAGYNAPFDERFVRAWIEKCQTAESNVSLCTGFEDWFDYKVYDVYPLFRAYCEANMVDVPNHKLVTMAEHFGLEHNAHEALSDIQVTYQGAKILEGLMGPQEEGCEA